MESGYLGPVNPPSGPVTDVWRVDKSWRVASVLAWIGALAAVVGVAVWSGWLGGLVFAGLMAPGAYFLWRSCFVPYVALEPDCLFIQNRITAVRVPYRDIKQISGGYYGLRIVRTNGTIVMAWAVQKSNFARWLGEHTRSDDVIDAIMARVPQDAETEDFHRES